VLRYESDGFKEECCNMEVGEMSSPATRIIKERQVGMNEWTGSTRPPLRKAGQEKGSVREKMNFEERRHGGQYLKGHSRLTVSMLHTFARWRCTERSVKMFEVDDSRFQGGTRGYPAWVSNNSIPSPECPSYALDRTKSGVWTG
jgi:hypothetical protein